MSRILATRAGRYALATLVGLAVGACTGEPMPMDALARAATVLSRNGTANVYTFTLAGA